MKRLYPFHIPLPRLLFLSCNGLDLNKVVFLWFITSGRHRCPQAENEARVLSELQHPNIIRYVDSGVSRSKLWIAMDYATGGDLDVYVQAKKKAMRRFSADEALGIFGQCCSALSYLHQRKILHRDLKVPTQHDPVTAAALITFCTCSPVPVLVLPCAACGRGETGPAGYMQGEVGSEGSGEMGVRVASAD